MKTSLNVKCSLLFHGNIILIFFLSMIVNSSLFSQAVLEVSVNQNPELIVEAGIDRSICIGDSIQIGGLSTAKGGSGEYFYAWYPNVSIDDPGRENPVVYPTENTKYYVTVTDLRGCSKVDSILITVNNVPDIEIGSAFEFCKGESITFDAGEGFETYQWSNGASTQIINVSEGGTYWVKVTNEYGCIGDDTIQVTEHENPIIDLGADLAFCSGESMVLDGGDGFASYQWSTGASTQTIDVSENGTYSVMVTNEYGCSSEDNLIVTVHENPIIDLGDDLVQNDSVMLHAGSGHSSYLWSNGSGEQQIIVKETGPYWVLVENEFGCTDADTINVEIVTGIDYTMISEKATLRIIPNPNSGKFVLHVNGINDIAILEIYDATGKVILKKLEVDIQNGYSDELFLPSEHPGIYLIKIHYKNSVIVSRMIKTQ